MRDYRNQIHELFRQAKKDSKYAALGQEYRELEKKAAELLNRMPEEEQNTIWAFVCTSDEMNWRMLEIICENMDT